VESSFLHALELNELSKEGTFRFRPALMINGGSIQMLRFFRALSIFFSLNFAVTLSPQNVIHSDRIGWDSQGGGDGCSAAYFGVQFPQARAIAAKLATRGASLTPLRPGAYKALSLS
jgi:hypothetical protein